MIKFNASKQITFNKQHRLGGHEEEPLLFSLVHLILCYMKIGVVCNLSKEEKYAIECST